MHVILWLPALHDADAATLSLALQARLYPVAPEPEFAMWAQALQTL